MLNHITRLESAQKYRIYLRVVTNLELTLSQQKNTLNSQSNNISKQSKYVPSFIQQTKNST